MSIFGKKEKNDEGKKVCACGGKCDAKAMEATTENKNQSDDKKVKVLGTGCTKCNDLTFNTKLALEKLNLNNTVEKVIDITEITRYGVMTTPALVINNKVVSYGKLLKVDDIVELLKKHY